MQMRPGARELTTDDFECTGDGPDGKVLDTLFDDLIGCDEVRATMDELRDTVEFSIEQGRSATEGVSFNYLFLGSPGTGKTTVARRMGTMFHALGLLAGDDMKELKASDLITGYAGQAGQQTRQVLKDARGGVLFIDEAYTLDPKRGGHYMTEAVSRLHTKSSERDVCALTGMFCTGRRASGCTDRRRVQRKAARNSCWI